MKEKAITLKGGNWTIRVTTDGQGSGSIESEGLRDGDSGNEGGDVEYLAAIDGIESLILAHACAGIDIKAKNYVEALETALDAISNRFLM